MKMRGYFFLTLGIISILFASFYMITLVSAQESNTASSELRGIQKTGSSCFDNPLGQGCQIAMATKKNPSLTKAMQENQHLPPVKVGDQKVVVDEKGNKITCIVNKISNCDIQDTNTALEVVEGKKEPVDLYVRKVSCKPIEGLSRPNGLDLLSTEICDKTIVEIKKRFSDSQVEPKLVQNARGVADAAINILGHGIAIKRADLNGGVLDLDLKKLVGPNTPFTLRLNLGLTSEIKEVTVLSGPLTASYTPKEGRFSLGYKGRF